MGDLYNELKRRNVFRVAIAYAVGAWVLLQVADLVLDAIEAPAWVLQTFLLALVLACPLVLLFSWAYEVTPEGLKREKDVDRTQSVTHQTARKLDRITIALLVFVLAVTAVDRLFLPDRAPAEAVTEAAEDTVDPRSVAVLAFEDLSPEGDQAYFSDGISEELLNLLAKVPDLRVPARTSSFRFKDSDVSVPEIARQLNVAHVLEGSVRKSGNRIRVTAQLIEADTGFHLWSENYDKELTDIFAIQDEISAAIVSALSATLGFDAGDTPHVTAAASPEAYNAYLLGQHQLRQRTKGDIEAAVLSFEKSLQHDPDYAPAHAAIGLSWYLLSAGPATYGTMTLSEAIAKAEPHIERALALDPKLADALGTKGLIASALGREQEAVTWYEKALAINPSQTDVRNWYSSSLQVLGHYEEALAQLRQAYQLDPLSTLTLNNYLNELFVYGRFDDARPLMERMAQIDPARGALFRARLLRDHGQAGEATVVLFRAIDAAPDNLRIRSSGSFALLALGLDEDAEQIWPGRTVLPIVSNTSDRQRGLALAREAVEEDPDNPAMLAGLAWANWLAGNTEEGERIARRYLESLPVSQQATDGTNWMLVLNAWLRGDRAALEPLLDRVEQQVDEVLAAGMVNDGFAYEGKAWIAWMRGERDRAYAYYEQFLDSNLPFPVRVEQSFRVLGWDEEPRFQALKRELEDYRTAEREEFLAVACGPDGFSFWQPAPATCAANAVDT